MLLENDNGSSEHPSRAELHATAAATLQRLRRYARTFPMARPRLLICLGWHAWLEGRSRAAARLWARAVRKADNLRMPYELACAQHELRRVQTLG
jgi:hypothetical protein